MDFDRKKAGAHRAGPKRRTPEEEKAVKGKAAVLAPVRQKTGIGGMAKLAGKNAGPAAPDAFERVDLGPASAAPGPALVPRKPRGPRPRGMKFDASPVVTADPDLSERVELGAVPAELEERVDLGEAAVGPDERVPIDAIDDALPAPPAAPAAPDPDPLVFAVPDPLPTFIGLTPGTTEWGAVSSLWSQIVMFGPVADQDRLRALNKADYEKAIEIALTKKRERTLPERKAGAHVPTEDDQAMVERLMEEDPALLKKIMVERAQRMYLADMMAGETGHGDSPYKLAHLLDRKRKAAELDGIRDAAAQLKAREAPGTWRNPANEGNAAELMRAYGLTEAEFMAIWTFTDEDFKYINPAIAVDEDFMAAQKQGKGKSAFVEGSTHAGVLMQALGKLPKRQTVVHRGMRINKAQFTKWFINGDSKRTLQQFESTSSSWGEAQKFAQGKGKKLASDDTIQVMCAIIVTSAVDIAPFSKYPGERELLILPGAQLERTSVDQIPTGDSGSTLAATEFWSVVIMQTGPTPKQGAAGAHRPGPPKP